MGVLVPARRRGIEYLDDPATDPRVMRRSLADVARANRLFGGTRAALAELGPMLRGLGRPAATLLDVGSGIGDIPCAARAMARDEVVSLTTIALDGSVALGGASRDRGNEVVHADARALPFADRSIDIVMCSQLLHHFGEEDARAVVAEMERVASRHVLIADIRRSWLAAAGIWIASFPLAFHPVSRHDGVVSVLRGFTGPELRALVRRAVGREPIVRRHAGFRITAAWSVVS